MNNLILGYGRLGKELVQQTQWDFISRSKNNFDFCNINTYFHYLYNYDIIINTIANTNTYSKNREEILKVNFEAVIDLANYCNITDKKLIHISTDGVYANSFSKASENDIPIHARTWYYYSKLLADAYIQAKSKKYLIIRTSFKPYPFVYPKAITSQKGNFDYTPTITKLIIQLINHNATGIFNVGTKDKTVYELAIQTNPNVPASDDVLDPEMPRDVTMNLSKMENFLKEHEK
jgi:dTDP-4-dehydrorhamnose reductase